MLNQKEKADSLEVLSGFVDNLKNSIIDNFSMTSESETELHEGGFCGPNILPTGWYNVSFSVRFFPQPRKEKKMRRVITNREKEALLLEDVAENQPIFAFLDGKLAGMIHSNAKDFGKWSLYVGGNAISDLSFATRSECVKTAIDNGYELFVED